MTGKRTGRRRGSPGTRESILEVARRLFADKGFDATTVRAIAADAGVDPAMINHYFGSKEELFRQTLAIPLDPATEISKIIAAGPERAGENLVRTLLGIWDSPMGSAAAAMFRTAMSNEWSARLLREFLSTQILRRVAAGLEFDPAEAQLRSSLVATQVAGLIMLRYIIKLEPVASLPTEELVRLIGPNLQRYITGSLHAAK